MPKVLPYLLVFVLGRFSYIAWRVVFLDQMQRELTQRGNALAEYEKALKEADEKVREKWKSMLKDLSYHSSTMNGDDRHWTEADDAFLESWSKVDG